MINPANRNPQTTPKGYVVFDLDITDHEAYTRYRDFGQAAILRFGGRVLSGEPAPNGIVECIEGNWDTQRVVIVEFDSVQTAREWYYSPEYQQAVRMRQASSLGRGVLVGGRVEPAPENDRVSHAVQP